MPSLLPKLIDAHTHLSGPDSGESSRDILACMDACRVEKVFLFAPLLNKRSWQLKDTHLKDIKRNNDYCAGIMRDAPERLLGFCVLNPSPPIGGGSLPRAVDLMIEEATRCRQQLGLRGVKMVPAGWYPSDKELLRLYEALAGLGMYTVFHTGIFMDGHESRFCRPALFEGLHQVPTYKAQLAHLSWPWTDEAVAVLNMETMIYGSDPAKWQLIADMSFGSPADWQLNSWQKALDTLPTEMICYGSDVFWPCTPERYLEQYLRPQLGLFETALTLGHLAPEQPGKRTELRRQVFYQNVLNHYQAATAQPQPASL